MIYALINNNTVVNTIVADEAFIAQIQDQYDQCVRVDTLSIEQQPSIGWSYDGETFTAPE